MYRWISSVPADRGMGLDWEARRVVEALWRRVIVSVMVEGDVAERMAINDSIAAIAGVVDGSLLMRRL